MLRKVLKAFDPRLSGRKDVTILKPRLDDSNALLKLNHRPYYVKDKYMIHLSPVLAVGTDP